MEDRLLTLQERDACMWDGEGYGRIGDKLDDAWLMAQDAKTSAAKDAEWRALFSRLFSLLVIPNIRIQQALSEDSYLVSVDNGDGTLDGFTGASVDEALAKALRQLEATHE